MCCVSMCFVGLVTFVRPDLCEFVGFVQLLSCAVRFKHFEQLRDTPTTDLRQAQFRCSQHFHALSFLSMSFRLNFVFSKLGAKTIEHCMELCAVYTKSQQWYGKD